MLKQKTWIIGSMLLCALCSTANATNGRCIEIGGMGLAEAIDETHLVAALSGDMTGARATITGQREMPGELILDMEHFFITNRNGLIKTRDIATLTSVPGKDRTFMLEINYKVVESRGTYAGFTGEFHSFGLIKLAEGKVVLRYKGELCKA